MKVHYRIQYSDVITNPRWRTTANTKIVMLAYLSEKNELIIIKLNQTMTMIK